MNEQKWREQGLELAKSHKAQQWSVADWIVEGIGIFHSDHEVVGSAYYKSTVYDEAECLFPDYSRETLRAFVYTAKAFPACTRVHANLFFGHYRAVLAAPENERQGWLQKANDARPRPWSVATLRLAIAEAFYVESHPEVLPKTDSESSPPQEDKLSTKQKAARQVSLNLPLPFRVRSQFEQLAQFRRTTPELLLARIIGTYLDEHKDEIEAIEHKGVEKQKQDITAQEEAFRKEFGMGRDEYEQMMAEKAVQREQEQERHSREWQITRRAELVAKANAKKLEAEERAKKFAQAQKESAPYDALEKALKTIHKSFEELEKRQVADAEGIMPETEKGEDANDEKRVA